MRPGDIVDDFQTVDQHGSTVQLSGLVSDGPVVLFFYPKAMTAGCTAESCHFRDLKGEFARYSATPVGISADPVEDQARFDTENSLGLTLLSDPHRAVAKQMGVKRMGPLANKRQTFVIDRGRRVVEVISSEMDMEVHADRALEVLSGDQLWPRQR